MILLFTDFGIAGPYVGQMHAVLRAAAPGRPVVDLMHDAPAFEPLRAGHLLAALVESTAAALAGAGAVPADPPVHLAVVDPGVGTERRPVVLRTPAGWFVGPDNGLFAPLLHRAGGAQAEGVRAWSIDWRPASLSASFHGRDLFAPVAARLARGEPPPGTPLSPAALVGAGAPGDLAEVIWLDAYGNAWTGLRAGALPDGAVLEAGGRRLRRAHTFGEVPAGEAFWYANSSGLVEIAVNCGNAAALLGLDPGSPVRVADGGPPGRT
ncbi:SAM hydrolase/SAM-dependent halogenase family protein [Rhodospirillum centenum]|uniref:SAM-dependent chlorinase/fluorinase n=1 Tax=Rhodospirillum centenum (strain ATCC 51521 / SW) TaxID=414684 RepID=B6IUL6_RHOCS|nr:SAM-dependent chlorinase/fluorinase [Rhodospirillum centenum]ACI99841.1 conserved hypothetical protein [Rhodospirillum centenum SW]